MNLLKLAWLQIAPGKTLEENLHKGISYCRKSKERGADLALFAEMWSQGYNIYERPVQEWQADGTEGIFIAELDLEQLRSYRENEVHGNAYRHPKKYGRLVEPVIDKPFIRKDYRE